MKRNIFHFAKQGAFLLFFVLSTLAGKSAWGYTVSYSVVDDLGGTLTADTSGVSIGASGAAVAEGQTVIFTAAPDCGYQVAAWSTGESGNSISVTVNSDTAITVAFEEVEPQIPEFEMIVILNNDEEIELIDDFSAEQSTLFLDNEVDKVDIAILANHFVQENDDHVDLKVGKNTIVVTAKSSTCHEVSHTVIIYRKAAADSIHLLDVTFTDKQGSPIDTKFQLDNPFNPEVFVHQATAKCEVDTVYLSSLDVNGTPTPNWVTRGIRHGLDTIPFTFDGVDYTIVVRKDFDSTIVVKKFGTLTVNNNAELNGGYKFNQYAWYYATGSEEPQPVGATGQYLVPDRYGVPAGAKFTVQVTTIDGLAFGTCPSSAPEVTPLVEAESLTVFPNPASAKAELQVQTTLSPVEQDEVTVSIYSAMGTFIRTDKLSNGAITAPTEPGMYLVQLKKGSLPYGSSWVLVK